jgi:glyoxylase-like metal-dependent hydrolase (beta-lactamase superfamily II)
MLPGGASEGDMQPSFTRLTRPRRWLIGSLTALILAGVLALGYRRQTTVAPDQARVPAGPMALVPYPITLVPGIHLLGGLAPAAAYVVDTSEGLVLVDSGLEPDADELKRDMAALGLNWRRIHAILLTHVHGDHSGGARYLRAATGARVYAGRDDAAILRVGQPRDAFFSTFPMPAEFSPSATPVDAELSDEQVLPLGDVRFRILASPGHTPGSVCYLMERGQERVLFSGDVIQALAGNEKSRSHLARPLGIYAAYLAPRYRGNARDFVTALRRLRQLPVPDLVLPGHPRLDPMPADPRLSQERWETLLDAGIRELDQLQARYEKDGANFLDGVPKRLLADLYYLGDYQDVAIYGLLVSGRLYIVNAPEGAGLPEFLRSHLTQLGLKPLAPSAVLLTSGDPEEAGGIGPLVQQYHCPIVALRKAWETLRKSCPPGTQFVDAMDLPAQGWFGVKPLALEGRGLAPVAYWLAYQQKSVLFTATIPVKQSRTTAEAMRRDFERGRITADAYLGSLERLADGKPDLWLPARPAGGQNANLYDSDWEEVLDQNRRLFRR